MKWIGKVSVGVVALLIYAACASALHFSPSPIAQAQAVPGTRICDTTGSPCANVDQSGRLQVNGAVTSTPSGTQTVAGGAASGSTTVGNPVPIAGSNGVNAYTLSTDTSGRLQINTAQYGGNAVSVLGTAAGTTTNTTIPMAIQPLAWSATAIGNSGVQASASQASQGATGFNVLTGYFCDVAVDGTAPTAATGTVNIRNGSSGAGSVIFSHVISVTAVAGAVASPATQTGLNVVGSANTAMTAEFTAGMGAHTYESCNITGYAIK